MKRYFVVAYYSKREKLLNPVFENLDDAEQFARCYLSRYKRVRTCHIFYLGDVAIQTACILAGSMGFDDDLPF